MGGTPAPALQESAALRSQSPSGIAFRLATSAGAGWHPLTPARQPPAVSAGGAPLCADLLVMATDGGSVRQADFGVAPSVGTPDLVGRPRPRGRHPPHPRPATSAGVPNSTACGHQVRTWRALQDFQESGFLSGALQDFR